MPSGRVDVQLVEGSGGYRDVPANPGVIFVGVSFGVIAAVTGTGLLMPPAPPVIAASVSFDPSVAATTTGYTPAALGTYKPSAATTGWAPYGITLVPVGPNTAVPGTALTTDSAGVLTVTTAGVVIQGIDLTNGYIKIKAANVTVRKCKVRGGTPFTGTTNGALVDCQDQAAKGAVINDNELAPTTPSPGWNGITGHDFTALRNNIQHTTDGIGIFNNNTGHQADPLNVTVQGNYIDNLVYISPDPNHANDPTVAHTHNDCIQLQGAGTGSTVDVGYNYLRGWCDATLAAPFNDILRNSVASTGVLGPNAAGGYNLHYPTQQANTGIQVNTNVANVDGLNIHDNWAAGGAECFNIPAAAGGFTYGTCRVTNNIFEHDQRPDTNIAIGYPKASGTWTVTGNFYTTDGVTSNGTPAKLILN